MKPSIYTRLNNAEKKLPRDSIEETFRRFFSKEQGLAIAKVWREGYQERFEYYFSRLDSLTAHEKAAIEQSFQAAQKLYQSINELIEADEKDLRGQGGEDSLAHHLAERFGDDFEEFKQVNKDVYGLACDFLGRVGAKELSDDEMGNLLNCG